MKKALDESTITNELKGASAFFSGARQQQPEEEETATEPIDRSENRTVNRSERRSDSTHTPAVPEPPVVAQETAHTVLDEVQGGIIAPQRATERYAFEIYSDQKRKLNRIRFLYEERTGRKLSASRIIREAIEPHLSTLEEQLSKP